MANPANIQMPFADWPVIRLYEGTAPVKSKRTKGEIWINRTKPDRIVAEIEGLCADACIIVAADVRPNPAFQKNVPDPVLGNSGLCIGYMVRNAVTGLPVPDRIRFAPCNLFMQNLEASPDMTVPRILGSWRPNRSEEICFRAGHAAFTTPVDYADTDRLFAATLGTDADNGDWWVLGALSALDGISDRDRLWTGYAGMSCEDRTGCMQHLVRGIRVRTGLPMQLFTPDQSRAMKQMLSEFPTRQHWDRFVAACSALGPEGQRLATAYQRAADAIWGITP